jgi:cobalt-zinc-cadmium efflux system protein
MHAHHHEPHGHDHGHAHRHGDPHDHHAHAGAAAIGAYRISTLLNIALVAGEAGAGLWLGSMALLGDAGHNLTDVLGLVLAWGATRLAARAPTQRHTYGMARSTILAALINAALLLVACGALAWESVHRLREVHEVPGLPVMLVAGFGVLVNAGSAALFWRARRDDVNARGAFLHMAADAAVSLGVVVVGGLTLLTGWPWLDPVAGIAVALVILVSSLGLMRDSLDLALDAVPRGMDVDAIRAALVDLSGVDAVHDLHVWPLSTTVTALTAHLEHDGSRVTDELLAEAQKMLVARFGIEHSTLQFETVGCGTDCAPAPKRR